MAVQDAPTAAAPTVADLGRMVKRKYPKYAERFPDDAELGRRVKAKFPAYARYVDVAAPAPAPAQVAAPPPDRRRAIAEMRAQPPAPAVAQPGAPAEFLRGLGSGLASQNVQAVGRTVQAAADIFPMLPGPGGVPVPSVGMRRAGESLVRAGQGQAQAPKVPDWRKARSARELFDYAQFVAGQGIASTVPSVVGGAAGTLVGGPVGGVVGAALPSIALNFGDVAEEVDRAMPGASAADRAKVAASITPWIVAFDVVPSLGFGTKIAKKMMVQKVVAEAAKRGLLRRGAVAGLKGAGAEGLTEGIQETIQALSVAGASGKPADPDDLARRAVDAMIGGALAGGPIGAVTEAIPQRRGPPGPPSGVKLPPGGEAGPSITPTKPFPEPTTGPERGPAGSLPFPDQPSAPAPDLRPSVPEAAAVRANIEPPKGLTSVQASAARDASVELASTVAQIQQRAAGPIRFEAGEVVIDNAYVVPSLVRVFPGTPNPVRVTVVDNVTGNLHSLELPSIGALKNALSLSPVGQVVPTTPGPVPERVLPPAGTKMEVQPAQVLEAAVGAKERSAARAAEEAKIPGRIAALERQIAASPGDKKVGKWRRRIEQLRKQAPATVPAPVAQAGAPPVPAAGARVQPKVEPAPSPAPRPQVRLTRTGRPQIVVPKEGDRAGSRPLAGEAAARQPVVTPAAREPEGPSRVIVPNMQFSDEATATRVASALNRSTPGADPKVVRTKMGFEIEVSEAPAVSRLKKIPAPAPAAPAPKTVDLTGMGTGIIDSMNDMIVEAAKTGRHPASGSDVSKWPRAERQAREAFLRGVTDRDALIRASRAAPEPAPEPAPATRGRAPAAPEGQGKGAAPAAPPRALAEAAALRSPGGRIFTGRWHADAARAAKEAGEDPAKLERGFVDKAGKFLTTDEAFEAAPAPAPAAEEPAKPAGPDTKYPVRYLSGSEGRELALEDMALPHLANAYRKSEDPELRKHIVQELESRGAKFNEEVGRWVFPQGPVRPPRPPKPAKPAPPPSGQLELSAAPATEAGQRIESGARSFIQEFEDLARQGRTLEEATAEAETRSGSEPPAGLDLEQRWSRVRREAQEALGQEDIFGGAALLGGTEPEANAQVATQREAPPSVAEAAARAEKPSEAITVPVEGLWYWKGFQQRDVSRETDAPTQDPSTLVNAAHVRMLSETRGGFDRDEIVRRPILVWRDVTGELGDAGRLYVIDGHHRSYMAKQAGEKSLPAVQVFGSLEYAKRQAELANLAGVPNTFSEQSRIAREIRDRGDSWERVAAQIRVRVSRAKAMVDFAHLSPSVRSDYFPSGNESVMLNGTAQGETIGRYARESPDLMTPTMQRQWLDQAVNGGLSPTAFAKQVREWHDMLKAAKQEVVDLPGGGTAVKLSMSPKQFGDTAGRLTKAIDAQVRQLDRATNSLESVSEMAEGAGHAAAKEFVDSRLAEIGKEGQRLRKAQKEINQAIRNALVTGMSGTRDLATSFDVIQKRVDQVLGDRPQSLPDLAGEGGFIRIPELIEALIRAIQRLRGIIRRDPVVRAASQPRRPAAVQNIVDALRSAEDIREQQERTRTMELGERVQLARERERGRTGLERHRARRSVTAGGSAARPSFKSIARALSEDNVRELVDMIYAHPALDFSEQDDAVTALQGLIGELGVQVPQERELELLELVFGSDMVEALTRSRDKVMDLRQKAFAIANISKILRTSFDLSAPLRQGIFLAARHPVLFARAFANMHRHWRSEEATQETLDNIFRRDNARLYRRHGLAITRPGGGVSLTAREEAFFGAHLLSKFPGVRRSERAYALFLDQLRADVYDSLVRQAQANGRDPWTDAALGKKLAEFVNAATGRGDSKFISKHAEGLNAMFFSPRLIKSRLHLLNPKHYIAEKDPFVRRQYWETALSSAAGGALVLTLAAWAGAQVEWERLNADYGKVRVGGVVYDVLGGFVQYLRLFPAVAAALWEAGTGRRPRRSAADLLWMFAEHKLSPMADLVLNTFRGWKMEQGTKRLTFKDLPKEVVMAFIPMLLEDFFEVLWKDPRQLIPAMAAATYGVSVQQYDRPGGVQRPQRPQKPFPPRNPNR